MVSAPPTTSKDRLRLWIRLLRVSRLIESDLRNRLNAEFGATLPRFDVMAALYRVREGMLMSDLSRFLLVSNGNVTGIVDRLVTDGFVERSQRDGDRRTSVVSLTASGVALFEEMAAAHEVWVDQALAGVSEREARQLANFLRSFRSDWETDS